MRRLFWWLLFVAGAMATGGCAPEGTYRIEWAFMPSGGSEEAPAAACGAHGVDAILIEAEGSEGQQNAIVPCTDGVTVRKILAATWNFDIHALGPDGGFKEPLVAGQANPILHKFMVDIPIAEDEETVLEKVVLEPQPACRDGVDNDRDGRVDTDDPQCPLPQWTSESEPPPITN